MKTAATALEDQDPAAMEAATTGGAQAIRRAVDVLRAVAQLQLSGATLSRVARATHLTTSTAFRILRTLTEDRLLRYDAFGRSYHIGALAYELGLAASMDVQVQTQWRSTVDEVARVTQLTTYLMARSDNDAVCLLCAQGSTALRAVPMDLGQRLPLGVGAGSLAILASLDDGEIARILAAERSRLEVFPGGKALPERILERVALTRRQGFAFSDGVVATGAMGLGLAIPALNGPTQLAVSVSAVAGTVNITSFKKIAAFMRGAIERNAHPGG
jgi:DNA-binding IclR family transcriptional regulator